jgi:hypothetical protein
MVVLHLGATDGALCWCCHLLLFSLASDGERSSGRGLVLRSQGRGNHQHCGIRVLNVQSLQLILDLVGLEILEGLDLGSEVNWNSLTL